MTTDFTDVPPPRLNTDFTDVPPPTPRGHPLIAWLVITAVVVALFSWNFLHKQPEVQQLDVFELQARSIVGAAALGANRTDVYKQAKELDRGPEAQRLRFAVLAGELKGSDEARERLGDLTKRLGEQAAPSEDAKTDLSTAQILDGLYHDYQDGDLSAAHVGEDDRRTLHQRLGWFGDLALNPPKGPNPAARAAVLAPAERSVLTEGAIAVVALGGAVVGVILLVMFAVLWRYMRGRVVTGSPYGGVYAESFALWLVVYIGLSFLGKYLPPSAPLALEAGAAGFLSITLALGWPVLRGIPWRQVRRDIGWWAGDRPLLEPFYGVLCYLAALPVVIVGALILAWVMKMRQDAGGHDLFGPTEPPTHPIVDYILHSGWSGWLQALFLASVMAPLMEETMFRGVLYRHLREATGHMGRFLSVALSALVVSFVFASLHPQGALAIPVLMALAFGFTAAREWRGSLIPSMTVHALHNGTLLLLLILTAA